MKRFMILSLGFILLTVLSAGVLIADDKEASSVYYTKANIWWEDAKEILSTNYHRGEMIPAGTKVKVKSKAGSEIEFENMETGKMYRLVHVDRHSSIGITDFFERYFSKTDPMSEEGEFQNFTKEEQKNIESGEITEGMSKDAVLMAYGYPPSHKTTSLESNTWRYWKGRFNTLVVHFNEDGKVDRIKN